jgi:uncharacterized membrane protein
MLHLIMAVNIALFGSVIVLHYVAPERTVGTLLLGYVGMALNILAGILLNLQAARRAIHEQNAKQGRSGRSY